MIIICTLLALLVACVMAAYLYKKQDIVTIIVQAFIAFLMLYVITSSIMLVFNVFTIIRCLIFVIIIEFIITAVLAVKYKTKIKITCDYRNCICAVLIFMAMLPFVIYKNGYLGVAQDAGVYQTRAIAMINGDFDNYFTFDEYDTISESEKAEYVTDIDVTLTGYYRTQTDGTFKTDKAVNDTTGILHGIHAYSAILALVGSIFGMANMMYTGSAFLFCMLYMAYIIMRNFKIRLPFIIAGVVLIEFSPAVLWLCKTTLSETFLILLIIEYIYLFTSNDTHGRLWLSVLPVITYSFFHISIYVLMPIFVFIYYIMFFYTENKSCIIANICMLLGYYTGFHCMLNVSSGYTYGNYKNLYMLKIVSDKNLVMFVTVVVFAAVIINIATLIIYKYYKNKIRLKEGEADRHKGHKDRRGTFLNVFIRVSIVIGCILVFLAIRKYNTYEFTSVFVYIISTGVFLIPVILAALIIKPSLVTKKKETFLLVLLFLYEVFAYSIVFVPYIGFYYYYARYVIIHIPAMVILGMYILNHIFSKGKLQNRCIQNVFVAACVLLICEGYKPYDTCIAKQQDQTTVSWETMEEILDRFNSDDAVVMSQEWSLSLKLPIKFITGADVYPVLTGNDKWQMDGLRSTHKNVYLMTEKKETIATSTYKSELTLIYAVSNEDKYGKVTEGEVERRGKYIPFSTIVDKNNRAMYLYK